MSRKRSDPSRAKAPKESIRVKKHARRTPPPQRPPGSAFAAESALRELHALLEGQKFDSADALNARLDELTSSGRLGEMASAWKKDDPKWQAQELVYDAMEAGDPITALELVRRALELDPACTDAQRLMVELMPMETENRVHLLREVVSKAEEGFGQAFLAENTGHFWGVLETRPYMRTLQTLAQLLVDAERLEEAAQVYERMLELNANDNQGARYELLALYLALRRLDAAARLFGKYPGEERFSAVFAWGRVLERWLAGAVEEAGAALARAREHNPFVERYLTGRRKVPQNLPPYYSPGDASEAQVAALELAPAIRSSPEFVAWLRARK
jgi:tetratricopeptide (TPR) repeat protein